MNKYNQKKLHERAAQYYREARSREIPQSINDIEAQLLEFEHLVWAENYDEAIYLLNDIGVRYLSLWGFLDRIIEMRSKLVGRTASKKLEIENLLYIADAFRMMGKTDDAISNGLQAAKIALEVSDELLLCKSYGMLGGIYRRLGQYTNAIENLNNALDLARRLNETDVELHASLQLGQILYYINQVEDAIKVLQNALSLAKKEKNLVMQGDLQGQLGYTALWLYNLEEALSYFNNALNIAQEVKNKRGQGYWYLGLGEAYLVGQQYEKAQLNFISAIQIADAIPDNHLKSYAGSFWAQAQLHKGDLDEANKSIITARKFDNPQHNDFKAMLHGVILARLNHNIDAEKVSLLSLELGKIILNKNPNLLEARWTKGISCTLLALLKADIEDPHLYLQEAQDSFAIVTKDTIAKGVIQRFLNILSELEQIDKGNLLSIAMKTIKISK